RCPRLRRSRRAASARRAWSPVPAAVSRNPARRWPSKPSAGRALVPPCRLLAKAQRVERPLQRSARVLREPGPLPFRVLAGPGVRALLGRGPVAGPERPGPLPVADDLPRFGGAAREQPLGPPAPRATGKQPPCARPEPRPQDPPPRGPA